jgi:hypothetical protein
LEFIGRKIRHVHAVNANRVRGVANQFPSIAQQALAQ